MDTVIMRFSWLSAARNLNDKQFREFVNKVAIYGFNECADDISSEDALVNSLLEMVKPSVRQGVYKYLKTIYE